MTTLRHKHQSNKQAPTGSYSNKNTCASSFPLQKTYGIVLLASLVICNQAIAQTTQPAPPITPTQNTQPSAGPPTSSPWGAATLAPSAGPAQVPVVPPPESYLSPALMPLAAQPGSTLSTPSASALSTTTPTNSPTAVAQPNNTAAPPLTGISPQDAAYAQVMGGDRPLAPGTTQTPGVPAVTGIAPPLNADDLDQELSTQAGPALPDAQLTGHRADASVEMDLKYRTALLDMQAAVNTKLLNVMDQDQQIRIALQRAQLPITVYPTVDASGQATAPASPLSTLSQTPLSIQAATPNISSPPPPATPVVYSIGGVGSHLTANILIPYSGSRQVTVGTQLPNGYRVIAINSFSVVVRGPDGTKSILPMGRSVPSTPPISAAFNGSTSPASSGAQFAAMPPPQPPPTQVTP